MKNSPLAILLCFSSSLCLHLLSPTSYRSPPPPPPPIQQALPGGQAELQGGVAHKGGEWCCSPEEAEAAVERVAQAAHFLVQVRSCLTV